MFQSGFSSLSFRHFSVEPSAALGRNSKPDLSTSPATFGTKSAWHPTRHSWNEWHVVDGWGHVDEYGRVKLILTLSLLPRLRLPPKQRELRLERPYLLGVESSLLLCGGVRQNGR